MASGSFNSQFEIYVFSSRDVTYNEIIGISGLLVIHNLNEFVEIYQRLDLYCKMQWITSIELIGSFQWIKLLDLLVTI